MTSFDFFKVNTEFKVRHFHGLDTLRAAAICLGLLWHFMQINANSPLLLSFLSTGPWGGANPLFIVSGYLLGHQILSRLVDRKNVSVIKFYFRRALKTWPSYLVVVGIVFMTPYFYRDSLFPPFWKFFTFTQNFNLNNSFLSHTWSLCIEEHFYLVLPFLSLHFLRNSKVKSIAIAVVVLLLASLILRGYIWFIDVESAGLEKFRNYFNRIYYPTYTRTDGLIMGVFLAYLQSYSPVFWKKLVSQENRFFYVGVMLCSFGFLLQTHRTQLFATLAVFPLINSGYGFLLIAAITKECLLSRIKIPGASYIATLSYALYLVHRPVYHILEPWLEDLAFGVPLRLLISVSLGFALSFLAAYLLFLLVERPFLKLRDRAIPTIEN